MLISAAVLPHPPALVPAVSGGAASELESIRRACAAALEQVLSSDPELVVVVGGGPDRATFSPGAVGALAGFGVPMRIALPGGAPDSRPTLPAALTIGAWLIQQHGDWPLLRGEAVPSTLSLVQASSLGAQWAASADRVAMIAMGDGSAALSVKAPGYEVDGAEVWQKGVTQALTDVDLDAVDAIEPVDAQAFLAAGLPSWQVLAGAARESWSGRWRGQLIADEAPYGVAYVVAAWTRDDA